MSFRGAGHTPETLREKLAVLKQSLEVDLPALRSALHATDRANRNGQVELRVAARDDAPREFR